MAANDMGARLKAERERLGMTVAQLAERSGIHRGLIYRIEAGNEASSATLRRLAAVGVRVTTLLAPAREQVAE